MKKLFTILTTIVFFSAHAQKNVLLDQSFWQTKPEVGVVKAEIEKGNKPSEFNPAHFDPVVLAINAQAPNATIKYLIDQPGNDVAKITHDSRTYLHWAANRGNTEIMEYLIAKGANVGSQDSRGNTPLNFAASGGQTDTKVYDILAANGVNLKTALTSEGANALLLAVANDKDLRLTDYFISKGLSLKSTDAAGNNIFAYAARGGNIEVLKALVAKGVPPSDNAFLLAAQGGRRGGSPIEVFQYLESLKLNPKVVGKNGENALHSIVRRPNQNEIVNYFLDKGVDVNQKDEDGNTVLMNAASSNRDTSMIGLILAKTKNSNESNKSRQTALSMAVRGNSADVVKYLVNRGADVNVLDKEGNNLAFYLIESKGGSQGERPGSQSGSNDFELKLKVLKAKGLDITSPQKNGNTLYHLAVAKNDLQLLKSFEGMKIDINSKNQEGLTPLHKAAMLSKDGEMIQYLLSMGAKKDIRTNFDETAFDLASENEFLSKNEASITSLK